jgi:SAM-dependent methyltransferase
VLRFGPHGFHEYRGKFFPQLVRSLCNALSLEAGDLVLDPMCGSGTTLVEARALDLTAHGVDANPLSRLISKVKTDSVGWDQGRVAAARANLLSSPYPGPDLSCWDAGDLAYLLRWFDSVALGEIGGVLRALREIDDRGVRDFGEVCLSNVLREVSYQKEDDLRVRRTLKPYARGAVSRLFRAEVGRNLDSVQRLLKVDPGHTARFRVVDGDARAIELTFPRDKGRVDAVVTSPPYATALPYLDTDRLSLIALGLLSRNRLRLAEASMIGTREIGEATRLKWWEMFEDSRSKLPSNLVHLVDRLASDYHGDGVGFRRRNLPALLARYFLDMRAVLSSIHGMLRPGGTAFLVVGTNSTRVNGTRVEIETDVFLSAIAADVGFAIGETINMELLPSRDAFKANRGAREQLLRFTKD